MNKLIRDRIPEIMKQKGQTPLTHTASDSEYKEKLFEKLREECDEFIESETLDELADITEVLSAIYQLKNTTSEEIDIIRKEKAEKRGSFTKKIILETV